MFLQIDVSHGQLLFKKRRKPLCLSRLKYFCWVIHPSFQLAVKLQNTSRKLGGNLRICTLLSALALAKCLGSSLYFFSYIHSRNLSRLAKTSRTAGQKVFRGVREREKRWKDWEKKTECMHRCILEEPIFSMARSQHSWSWTNEFTSVFLTAFFTLITIMHSCHLAALRIISTCFTESAKTHVHHLQATHMVTVTLHGPHTS